MKKRLLALALCLVLMVSLLPITAAARTYNITVNSVQIEASGVKKDWVGTYPDVYQLIITNWNCQLDYTEKPDSLAILSFITSDKEGQTLITADPVEGETNFVHIAMHLHYNSFTSYYDFAGNFSASSSLKLPGYKTKLVEQKNWKDDDDGDVGIVVTFSLTKEHEHDWQFTQTDSTLTASCWKGDIGPLNLTLKADSVTLPNSPFNARLEGLEQFKKEVPSAVIGDFVYKYKGSGDSEYRVVTPTAANAKAGEYQVGVRISGLLVDKEYPPVAYSLEDGVNQGVGDYADLYVQYTAADPKVTAQTGDNRPIELMMAGILVFSALAAAAFVLDGKRKYRQ